MYLIFSNCDDCLSEQSTSPDGKGKTLKQAVYSALDDYFFDDHEEDVITYDNKHIYVGEEKFFDIEKI